MSDLPRFYEGAVGRLDFTHLNEVMRRLDLLLPLIEAAGTSEERDSFTRRPVFLCKAKRQGSGNRYEWREVVISPGDRLLVETDDDWGDLDEFDVSFRSGGIETEDKEDDNEERYAVLADPTVFFEEGLAICFAMNRADKVRRYVLVPFATSSSPAFFMVTGGGGATTITVGEGQSIQANAYSGNAYTPGAPGEEWTVTSATVYDLSRNAINQPATNAPAVDIRYHSLESGTCLSPNWIDSSTGYFGAPCRLDFNCKG